MRRLLMAGLAAALAGCFAHGEQQQDRTAARQAPMCSAAFNRTHVSYVGKDHRAIQVSTENGAFELTFERSCPGLTERDFEAHGLMIDQIELPMANDEDDAPPQESLPEPLPPVTDLCDPSHYRPTGNNMDRGPHIRVRQDAAGARGYDCPIASARPLAR